MMKQTGKVLTVEKKSVASELSLLVQTTQEGKLFFHLMIIYSFV